MNAFRNFISVLLFGLFGLFGLAHSITAQPYVPHGGTFTPQGQLNVLVVYAGFTNDNTPASPIYYDSSWPWKSMFPTYADQIFYPDSSHFSPVATDKSLSNYFYQMSKGSPNPLKVVGHRLNQRIDVTATNEGNQKGWGYYFEEVYKEMRKLKGVDWSRFDQRQNEPNYAFDNSISKPDGKLDFVIVVFRFNGTDLPYGTTTRFLNDWGMSRLFAKGTVYQTPPDSDSTIEYKITTGFSIARGMNGVGGIRSFFLHENAHEMYNMPHVFGTNGAMGNKFYTTNGWGMMGINKILNCANGWERWILGWIDLKHDLKGLSSENGIYYLDDYLTSGDVIRIEVPHTDGKQHLWLENHQGKSVFDDRDTWDGKIFPAKPRDLLMYVESMPSSRFEIPQVNNMTYVNGIRVISASGNYDYVCSDTFRHFWQVGNNPVFDFYRQTTNPIAGYSDVNEIRMDYMGTNLVQPKDKTAKPDGLISTRHNHGNELGCRTCQSEFALFARQEGVLNFPFLGEHIGFREGSKIDLSSNPVLTNTPFYDRKSDRLTPYYLNGISIEVLEKSADGRLKIRIKFDQTQLLPGSSGQGSSTRYTGNLILKKNTARPPGSSLPDLSIGSGFTLRLDQGATPNQQNRIEGSTTPFTGKSSLTIENGACLKIEAKSTFIVSEGSTLVLEKGSTMVLDKKGKLVLNRNSQIVIKEGATLINNGKIVDRRKTKVPIIHD